MSVPDFQDTIAALATPSGEGGLAVIRISGPTSFEIAEKIFQPQDAKKIVSSLPSHTVHLGIIPNPAGGFWDQVLLTLFRAPHSFTGEDVIEISTHGGRVVTRKILEIINQAGARQAEPGEFTRRAFLAGKIDLTQAEAVLDLIKAKSDQSLKTAAGQLAGELSRTFKKIRQEILQMYAHMEAFLDFPDEDLEIFSDTNFRNQYRSIAEEMKKLIAGFKRGVLIREGASIVLAGKPNVGKSSLFNALLARDRAIVSELPGTTRDVLEEAIEIEGWYLKLVDTAGLASQSQDPVEKIGMERTRKLLGGEHIYLFLVDGSSKLTDEDFFAWREIPSSASVLIVINKSDLPSEMPPENLHALSPKTTKIPVSALSREGLDGLETEITKIIAEHKSIPAEEQITRLRHKVGLEKALESLEKSEEAFLKRNSLEFVIVDLKQSLEEMKELVGEVYSENLLDVLFSEFCIGK